MFFYSLLRKSDIFHIMKYKEYLHTAQRHLVTCRNFYDSINWTEARQWDYFKRFRKKKRKYEKEKEKFLKKLHHGKKLQKEPTLLKKGETG